MDQNIGIVYGVTGHDKVMNAMAEMGNSASKFRDTMGSAITSMNAAFASTEQLVGRLVTQINSLKSATQSLSQTTRSMQSAATQRIADIAPSPVKGSKDLLAGSLADKASSNRLSKRAASQAGLLKPSSFLARWWSFYMGASGASHFGKDVLLAGSREKMVEPLRDLGMVGFSAEQRKKTEITGQRFVRGMWAGGDTQDYLKSTAEVASALDVNDPAFKGRGVEEINRMAQMAMKLGASSQMSAQQATKLLMAATHAQKFQMPESLQQRYDSGELSVADLAEKTGSKIAKIVKISSTWGTDIQHFLNYALPSALSKGWTMDKILGLEGTLRTAGYPGQKAGRATKSILEAEGGKLAGVALAGHDDPRIAALYMKSPAAAQKRGREMYAQKLDVLAKRDTYAYFDLMGKAIEKAEARGIDPVRSLGMSKEWIGIVRTLTKSGTIAKWKKSANELEATSTMAEVDASIQDIQSDSGWLMKRLGNSWAGMTSSLGRNTPLGKTVESWMDGLDMLTDFNNGAEKFNYKTALMEGKDFLLHGALFGTIQEVANFTEAGMKMTGLLSENTKLATVEELWSGLLGKIDSAYNGIQSFVNAAGRGFDQLDAALKPLAESVSGIFSKINPLGWFKGGEAMAAGVVSGYEPPPGDLMSPSHIRARDNPGILNFPSQPPAEMQSAHTPPSEGQAIVVHPEVKVLLDGRQLESAVISTLRDNAIRNRQTFGGGALGGLNLK